jgi:MFS family permease
MQDLVTNALRIQLPDKEVGPISLAYMIAVTAGGVVFCKLIDKVGDTKLVVRGVPIMALSLLLLPFAESTRSLMNAWVINGLLRRGAGHYGFNPKKRFHHK